MGKMRHAAYALISVVAFLVLAVVAAVQFSGSQEKTNALKEGALYKTAGVIIQKVELLLTAPAAINIGENLNSQGTLISPEEKNKFLDKIKEYIQMEKTTDGWQLTLRNNEEIIFQKTF